MKKLFPFLLLSTFLISLSWASCSLAFDREEAGRLQIIDGVICLKISSLKCLGSNTQFLSDVGKLHCLTRIVGALNPISVTHVWYFGDKERLRVSLAVKSANWRTYSSKTIRSQEIGDWSVEVLGPLGEPLGLYKFEISPTPDDTSRTSLSDTRRAVQKIRPSKKAASAKAVDDERTKSPQDKASTIIGKKIRLRVGEKEIDRLFIDLNHYTTPVVLILGGATPKVAIHIMNVSFWDGRPEIPVNGKIIRQIRSKLHYNSKTLRILLDLDPKINCDVKSYLESKHTYCVEVSENRQENEEK